MWSVPPPVAAILSEIASTGLNVPQQLPGVAVDFHDDIKSISDSYLTQWVCVVSIILALSVGIYVRRRYLSNQQWELHMGTSVQWHDPLNGQQFEAPTQRRGYVQIAGEPGVLPIVAAHHRECGRKDSSVQSSLAALVVIVILLSGYFMVYSAWSAWQVSPLPVCPHAEDLKVWWSSGARRAAFHAVFGGFVCSASIYGLYRIFQQLPEAKDGCQGLGSGVSQLAARDRAFRNSQFWFRVFRNSQCAP